MTRELVTEIEGRALAARVGVAGGLRQFVDTLRAQEAFQQLREACRERASSVAALNRLVLLSRLSIDLRYENPNDTAIAAYLMALSATSSELEGIALNEVLGAQNLWWANQVARAVLAEATGLTQTQTVVVPGSIPLEHDLVWSVAATFSSGLIEGTPAKFFEGARDTAESVNWQLGGMVQVAAESQYALSA